MVMQELLAVSELSAARMRLLVVRGGLLVVRDGLESAALCSDLKIHMRLLNRPVLL